MALDDYISIEAFIILIVLIALLAILMPALFNAQNGVQTDTLVHIEGQSNPVKPPLYATIVNVNQDLDNSDNNTVSFYLENQKTGDSTDTFSGNEGDSFSLDLSNETVNVTITNVVSSNSSSMKYDYPAFYGMPEGFATLIQFVTGFIVIILTGFVWFLIMLQKEKTNG